MHDVRNSARYYVDVLGFDLHADHGGWIFVKKDDCMIMLGACPDDMPASDLGCHSYFAYLRVDDVDAFFAVWRDKGVRVINGLADKPWGMREFGVQTPDGHRIMIGQTIAASTEA